MKKYLIVLAGGLLFATTAAMAAPQQHGRDSHHGQSSHDRNVNHNNRNNHGNNYYVVHERGRREGWYRKGGHVPTEYRGSHYVVSDWRTHHLRQPPRGYHWVRSDNNEFLLVAISTGIIASILTGN